MRSLKILALVLPLTLCGCLLTTTQLSIDYDLGTIQVSDPDNLVARQVDLNTIEDYVEHKSDIAGVADLALLGEITNNLGVLTAKAKSGKLAGGDPTLNVVAYITPGTTNFTNEKAVVTNGVPLWGPIVVPPGATQRIDWDASAGLFSPAGKAILLNEIKGDGVFTIYLLGTSGFYDFTIDKATLVLTLEAEL